jgi:peptidoglycan hydrolase-like protein with peptidoglycan-binding domain
LDVWSTAAGDLSGEVGGAVDRRSPQYTAWVQRALNQILSLNLAVDGIMGPQTRSAVRSFQEQQGLTVDGVVGPQTESALLAAGAPPPAGAAPPVTVGATPAREEIRWIQMALNQILGLNLAVDGLMGPQTSGALGSFQMQQGLPASGSIDSPTSSRLALALAGRPPAQVCALLKEKEILDNFAQAKADVRPAHEKKLAEIALCVRERLRTADPIRSISIIGHASTEGDESFNRGLGQGRADRVKLHLARALDRVLPGLSNQVAIQTDTRGESEPLNRGVERDRRVEIFLPIKPKPAPPPPNVVTQDIKIVVKSFIAPIGGRIGAPTCSLLLPAPVGPPLPTTATMRLIALAAATDLAFSENPRTDRKDKGYRLFSERTFRVTCTDGRIASVVPSGLDTDAGRECLPGTAFCLQPPPLIASGATAIVTGPNSFDFSWTAKGRPHPEAEPSFQAVCPRTSIFIWHTVSGRIECTGSTLSVNARLTGSRFPSHRVFVNGVIQVPAELPQGVFSNLWRPDTSDDTLVQ